MSQALQILFRSLFGFFFVASILLCDSSVRAQTITTVDALWAWDGQNVSVCQNPTSSASISGCFGDLAYNAEGDNLPLPLATDGTYVYLATARNGWAYKCPLSGYGLDCIQILVGPFGASGTGLTSLAASDGYLWTGQSDGSIYRCPSDMEWSGSIPSSSPPDCVLLDDAGDRYPNTMIIANGWLYVGLFPNFDNGSIIWRCDLSTSNSCANFDNPGNNFVNTLSVGAGYLWAGLNNGILWRCDLNNANGCLSWDTAGGPLQGISYDNQGGLAVGVGSKNSRSDSGVFWSCSTATSNSCATMLSNKNMSFTAAGNVGSAKEYFGNYTWASKRQIFNNASAYPISYQDFVASAVKTPLLYIPEGGVVTLGSVNVSVPLNLRRNLAKFAKRCDRGGRVMAQASLQGPYGKIRRNVNLCKLITSGVPKINFGALDKEAFYKATVRIGWFKGDVTFYLSKDDEVKDVAVELKVRGN